MKLFWAFIIGVGVLLLMGASFGGSLLFVGITCLIIAVMASLANGTKENKNKQPQSQTDNASYLSPITVYSEKSTEITLNSNSVDEEQIINISIGVEDIGGDIVHADSIIDVTEEGVKLDIVEMPEEQKTEIARMDKVPWWPNTYIYSTSELKWRTTPKAIRQFYTRYKVAFLKGDFLNLEGNTNYSFTLLFDLLEDYDKHKDFTYLVRQLQALSQNYPETERYVVDNLVQRAKLLTNSEVLKYASTIASLIEQYPDSHYWTFADKYAKKFNLSPEEIRIFNHIASRFGNYYYVPDLILQTDVRFFRDVIARLGHSLREEGKVLDDELNRISRLLTLHRYSYNSDSDNRKIDKIQEGVYEIYGCIWTLCNNKFRLKYDFGYSNADIYYSVGESNRSVIVANIMPRVRQIVKEVLVSYPGLSDEEEIAINQHYHTRWRPKFQLITESYQGDIEDFINKATQLAKQNKTNYGVGYLLFDAAKFLVGKDDIAALKMYLKYVEVFCKFSKEPEKPLPKYICKKIFKKLEQQVEFEAIIEQYKKDGSRQSAHEAISQLFLPKRKKLNLNREEITKISEQHFETVQLLNEVLNEEDTKARISEYQRDVIVVDNNESCNSNLKVNIQLNSCHLELLDIFVLSNHTLTKSQVIDFAKSKGVMANRLIETINELCYDTVDDVLIEEDGDNWTISEEYFKYIRQ